MAKTTLNRRFLIELDGQFVNNLFDTETANLTANREEKYPVSMGDREQAAIFTLQNGLLLCDNGLTLLVLGRSIQEESTTFDPQPMYWASQFNKVKSVQYTGEGEEVQLESFGMLVALIARLLADSGVDFPLGALLDEDGQTRLYACHPSIDIGEQRGFWGVGLLLMVDLIRTWNEVALGGDEGVVAARGCCPLAEVRGIAGLVGNARGCGSSPIGEFVGADSGAACEDDALAVRLIFLLCSDFSPKYSIRCRILASSCVEPFAWIGHAGCAFPLHYSLAKRIDASTCVSVMGCYREHDIFVQRVLLWN